MDSDRISEHKHTMEAAGPEQLPSELLRRGDPLEWRIEAYLHEAEWRILRDDNGRPSALVGCLRMGAEEAEIVNAAVEGDWDGRATEQLLDLLRAACDEWQRGGARRLVAYAGNWESELLTVYQRAGFRIAAVEPDYYADCWPGQTGAVAKLDRLMLERLEDGRAVGASVSAASDWPGAQPVVRRVELRDSQALTAMKKQLDRETTAMLYEPGERRLTDGDQLEQVRSLLRNSNSLMWVAESEGRIVGYLEATGGKVRRNQHTVYIVVGILETETGRGLGRRLFDAMFEWAARRHVLRAELTVQAPNQRAYRLYRSIGFKLEGIMRGALIVEGEPVDLYQMGCDLRTIRRGRVDK